METRKSTWEGISQAPKEEKIWYLSIEGPIWLVNGGLFGGKHPKKNVSASIISVMGSTLLSVENNPLDPEIESIAGMISRIIPSFVMCELLMQTEASVTHIVPMVGDKGFGIHHQAVGIKKLCAIANGFDFFVYTGVDLTEEYPLIRVGIIDVKEVRSIGKFLFQHDGDIGATAGKVAKGVIDFFVNNGYVRSVCPPEYHKMPTGNALTDFLLRSDQILGLMVGLDSPRNRVGQSESDIFDGLLSLVLGDIGNPTVRMLFFTGYHFLSKIFPKTWENYQEKFLQIEKDYPVEGDVG